MTLNNWVLAEFDGIWLSLSQPYLSGGSPNKVLKLPRDDFKLDKKVIQTQNDYKIVRCNEMMVDGTLGKIDC